MQISDDTQAVLSWLDNDEGSALRKRNDLGVLMELAATQNDAETFNRTVHTGTALWKLYSVLRKQQAGADGYANLEREFGAHLNSLRELLAQLTAHADDDIVRRFDETYFGMTQGVIRNLVDLGHDLARFASLRR
jgi:hypothetical protein